MAGNYRASIYGIGCITEKTTYAKRNTRYVYAEWSVDGKRSSKSCGNATDPNSRKRAMDKLREVAQDRVDALQSEIERLQEALKSDAE